MKAKQWQEVRSLSGVELEAKMRTSQEQLFRVRFKHGSNPVKNALQIRTVRREIAQFKTLLQEKSVSSGEISK